MAQLEFVLAVLCLGMLNILYPSTVDHHTVDDPFVQTDYDPVRAVSVDDSINYPVVQTKYGPIRGVSVEEGSIFQGVPFAAPPVGALRWQPPQPPAPWAPNIYNATTPSAACIQKGCGPDDDDDIGECPPSKEKSEDCLYLNVFAPRNTDHSKLPVVFWIHGGNFWGGSAMGPLYDGRFLANKTKTVVVAANYRVGSLGFLVAGHGEGAAAGNYGILDQIAALQWIQDNIADFGGDKDRVTIYGQSAGAYSVALHMTLNKSDHLFHRAIASSPPLTFSFKSKFEALVYGEDFTRLLNCPEGDMQCLKSAPASEILQAQLAVQRKIVNPFRLEDIAEPWGPTIDEDLGLDQVMNAFERGRLQNKSLIIGSTTEEALFFIYYGTSVVKELSTFEYETTVYGLFLTDGPAVLRQYPPSHSGDEYPVASALMTHYGFPCPARYIVRNAAKHGEAGLWLYVFAHPISFEEFWNNRNVCKGHVCHETDIVFTFQSQTLRGYHFTPDEQVLADSMAYYYGNFAHTGDPNKPGSRPAQGSSGIFTRWPPYLPSENYTNLRFDTPSNSLEQGYLKEKCDFWDSLNRYP